MRRGFTLVEVVIALVVLELGVMGVLGTLVLAARTLTDAERLERATLEALRVADSLSTIAAPGAASHAFRGGRVAWEPPVGAVAGRVVVVDTRGDTLVQLALPGSP